MASKCTEMRTSFTATVDKNYSSFFCFPSGFTCCKEHISPNAVEEYGVYGVEHREDIATNSDDQHIKCTSWTKDPKKRPVGGFGAFPSFAQPELENGIATLRPSRSRDAEEIPFVDFAGSWICVGIDGDMDKFLSDMGLGPAQLAEARTDMWGVKRQVQNISQTGNNFVVQNVLTEPVTMNFRVGGGRQTSVDQVGRAILVNPVWEGDALAVTTCGLAGDLIATTRRYLESPSRMVLELTSPSKSTVKRIFDRRTPGGGFPSMPMYQTEQTSQSSMTTSTKDTNSVAPALRADDPEGLLGMMVARGVTIRGPCNETEPPPSVRNERCCLSAINCEQT